MGHLDTMNDTMVTLHANYINGNTKNAQLMNSSGFWLSDDSERFRNIEGFSNACKAYVPAPYVLPPGVKSNFR
jgi:hypothetical protein